LEPGHFTMLSHIFLKGIFGFLKTCGFVIGTRLNVGEFLLFWRYHECNDDHHEAIYADYPELRSREYGEADATRYDQSLVYKILYAVGIFFCCFYKYDNKSMVTVMSDIVFRLCSKFLYLVGVDEVKYVMGMMFSGKFETSHGNTAYQNLVFQMYLTHLLEKWSSHPKYYLLKLSIYMKLITGSFSGDDMFLGWPTILREIFSIGLEDYKAFCGEAGLSFKYSKIKPLYGTVFFVKEGSFFREVRRVDGITFLKNQMSMIYEDGILQGVYPYRPFKDLVFRIGNSDRANQYLDTFFAKLLSLSYLSVGNTEFYDYLNALYLNFQSRNPNMVFDKDICSYISRGSLSMYYFMSQVDQIDEKRPFPTLEFLRKKHDRAIFRSRPVLQDFNTYYSESRGYEL